METRKPLDMKAYGLMLFFCISLGLQQISLKLAGMDIAPVLQLSIRSALSAILVLGYFRISGRALSFSGENLRAGLLVGLLFSFEYILVGEALRFTTASRVIVFLYTAPLFTALFLHFLVPEERLSKPQQGGMVLAFLGIIVAFWTGGTDTALSLRANLGDVLALLAGLFWALTNVAIRKTSLSVVPASQTLLYQLVVGAIVLFIAAAMLDQLSFRPTLVALSNIAFQTIVVSFAAFLAWFWMLRTYNVTRISVLSFLTPLFGVGFSALLLHETVPASFIAGSVLVVVGLMVVSLYKKHHG
ncbi:DMT family transporter [Bartonella sp. LJL80]